MLLLWAACASLSAANAARLQDPLVTRGTFEYRDGGHATYYVIDKSFVPSEPRTYAFILGGSDCGSFGRWLPQYFRGLEGESEAIRIVAVQKRFVEDAASPDSRCSAQFTRADHPGRWLEDYSEFIESMLRGAAPLRVLLVGISEGAEVAPLLARRIAAITHLALLASGGMDADEAFMLQMERLGRAGAASPFALSLARDASVLDDADEALGGRTARYWRELRELQPTRHLLHLTIPVLVAIGDRDEAIPVQTAFALRERFAEHGKSNLTTLIYHGADHALFVREEGRSRLPDFWHCIEIWLEGEAPTTALY